MVPTRKLRTYNPSSSITSSVDAFNSLFAKNMTQRLLSKNPKRKKKLFVRELPNRIEKTLLTDDSLQVSLEDTFDKLKKCPLPKKAVTSKLKNDLSSKLSDSSPMLTRQRKQYSNLQKNVSDDSIFRRFEETTVDSLHSIEIEIETNKNNSKSLSYIQIPKIIKNRSKIANKSNTNNSYAFHQSSYTMEESFNNIFSKTFIEKQPIHSSTPVCSMKQKFAISPLKNVVPLIKQSLDDIKKWEHEFPLAEKTNTLPADLYPSSVSDFDEKDKNNFINLRKRKVLRKQSPTNIEDLSQSNETINTVDESKSIDNSLSYKKSSSYNLEDFESFSQNKYSQMVTYSISRDFRSFERTVNRRKPRRSLDNKSSLHDNLVNHSVADEGNSNSNYLVVNLSRKFDDKDFANLYSSCISHTESATNNQTTEHSGITKKDVVINLTNNNFENFYQHHYSELGSSEHFPKSTNTDHSHNLDKCNQSSSAMKSCKDLIVNVTKREDLFEKFYHNSYSEIKSEINRREESETEDNIKCLLTELIVNVTKNEFKDYSCPPFSSEKNRSNLSSNDKPEYIRSSTRLKEISPEKIHLNSNITGMSDFNVTVDHDYCKTPSLIDSNCNSLNEGYQNNSVCNNKLVLKIRESYDSIIDGSDEDSLYKHLKSNLETLKNPNHMMSSTVDKHNTCPHPQNVVIDLTESGDETSECPDSNLGKSRKNSEIIESSLLESSRLNNKDNFKVPSLRKLPNKTLVLRPGKLWRRSLLTYRKSNLLTEMITESNCNANTGKYL